MSIVELEQYNDPDFYDKRWYRGKDALTSEWFISVTAVLDDVIHPKLKNYFKNTSKETQDEKLKTAIDRGQSIHEVIELSEAKKPYTLTDTTRTALEAWQALKEKDNIIIEENEKVTYHPELGYAGTFDMIGTMHGNPTMFDIKSGRYGIKTGWQLAAYREAQMKLTGIKELGLVGVSIPANKEPKLFKYEHLDWCWNRFADTLGCFRGQYFYELNKREWKYLKAEPHRY